MARVDTLPHFLTDVADAIRSKTKKSEQITAENFDTEIRGIEAGGMLLFNSVEEMNADTTETEGTLGTVYSRAASPIQSGVPIMAMYFPKTITLDTAVTEDIFVNGDHNFLDYLSISSTGLDYELSSHGDGFFQAQVFYNSSDGITYARQDNYEDGPFNDWMLEEAGMTWENDCLTFSNPKTITFELPEDTAQAHIVEQLLISKSLDFLGVYEYKTATDFTQIYGVKNLQKDGDGYTYDKQLISVPNFQTAVQSIYSAAGWNGTQSNIFYDQANHELIIVPELNDTYYVPTWSNMLCGTSSSNTGTFTTTYYRADPMTGEYLGKVELTGEVIGSWHYSGQTTTYYWVKYMDRPSDWLYLQFLSWYPSESSEISKRNVWNNYAYLINSYENDTWSNVQPYSEEDVGFPDLTKWFYATTSCNLASPNQLLPGIKGYGKNGVITGNNSIYNNLDMSQLVPNVFGITTVKAKRFSSAGDRETRMNALTKYVGSRIDTHRQHYYKLIDGSDNDTKNILTEIKSDFTNKWPNTNTYFAANMWRYIPEKNLIVYVTYSSPREVVFEDGTTHEVLHRTSVTGLVYYSFNSSEVISLISTTSDAVYLVQQVYCTYESGGSSDAKSGIKITRYDLDTYEESTIHGMTFSGVSKSGAGVVKVIDGKYLLCGIESKKYSATSSTATTCYSYAYLYDMVANKLTTIREDTMSTTSTQVSNITGVKTQRGNIYIISNIADGKKVRIHQYDPATYSISLIAANESTGQAISPGARYAISNAYEDDNYFMCGNRFYSKSTCEYWVPSKLVIKDSEDNVLYSSNAMESYSWYMFTQADTMYIWAPVGKIYKLSSYTVDHESKIITGVCSKVYVTSNSDVNCVYRFYYTFPNLEEYITRDYTLSADDTFAVEIMEDENVVRLTNVTDNQQGLDIILHPAVETTSLDYDYSTLYCDNDFFVQFRERPAISSTEYNNSLTLSEEILGEEEQ